VKEILRSRARSWVQMLLAILLLAGMSLGQSGASSERTFSQSKDSIQQLLKRLQPAMAGHLPALEGFVTAGDQPLDHYRRAFYQTMAQVSATPKGSIVRVTTKITAWYTDPAGTHSGYRLLTSNGRLESDFLDQVSEELAASTMQPSEGLPAGTDTQDADAPKKPSEFEPSRVSRPGTPTTGPFSAPLGPTLPARDEVANVAKPSDRSMLEEIKNLEEVIRNQAHPNNLVIVKQSGTAVVASPSLTAKTLLQATAHDEFEMLDFNADWVHVRISGLSRGWIWRNSVEMPDGIPETATRLGTGPKAAAEQLFHVTREETAAFPGDWEPLKGRNVKILSIEKVNESASDSGVIMRLEFAKAEIAKNYPELAKSGMAGIVLIFDSVDGGMIAATLPAMQQWKAGNLSDSAFWHQCFFDPPELGGATGTSGSR
jgi:hypothetical protein